MSSNHMFFVDPAVTVARLKALMYTEHYEIDGLDVSYDSYFCDGCYGCETGDDYCRGAYYSNLHIESVDLERVLAYMFSCHVSDIPESLIKFATSIGMDKPDAYHVVGVDDYYGEILNVSIDPTNFKALESWLFAHADANDLPR